MKITLDSTPTIVEIEQHDRDTAGAFVGRLIGHLGRQIVDHGSSRAPRRQSFHVPQVGRAG